MSESESTIDVGTDSSGVAALAVRLQSPEYQEFTRGGLLAVAAIIFTANDEAAALAMLALARMYGLADAATAAEEFAVDFGGRTLTVDELDDMPHYTLAWFYLRSMGAAVPLAEIIRLGRIVHHDGE